MKNTILIFLVTFFLVLTVSSSLQAKLVTKDEAATIAKNWVAYMIHKKGDWNGDKLAYVDEILEFKRGDRLLGYYCTVVPKGFVLVSLLRELPPVKGYSTSSDLDPNSDEGPADLFKTTMKDILDQVEAQVGPIDKAGSDDLAQFLGTSFRIAWTEIESGIDMNYTQGDTLVDTYWHQGDPYNRWCPAPPEGDDCTEPRCVVGCVATAGAQIMRYWCWPPYGVPAGWNDPYDWVNMPLGATLSSPQVEIDAVAELSSEVGIAVGMQYCGGTGCQSEAYTYDMVGVYAAYFRYHPGCGVTYHTSWDPISWFEVIKGQLNLNRPVHYRVVGHSIVCDGWQEIGGAPLRQYHMNYGWANNFTTWYTLDNLHLGNPAEEYMVVNIVPVTHLGGSLAGTYPLDTTFPYRYFDLDASGTVATFDAGQYLQSLPGIKITCAAGTGNNIRFLSTSGANTRMFTRGDISNGARLQGGAIKLDPGGSLRFN